jgi:hypothetical protein
MNKFATSLDVFGERISGRLARVRTDNSNVWIFSDKFCPHFVGNVLTRLDIPNQEKPLTVSFLNDSTWIVVTSKRVIWRMNGSKTSSLNWNRIDGFCFDRSAPRWIDAGRQVRDYLEMPETAKKVYDKWSIRDVDGNCHDLFFAESLYDYFRLIFKLIIERNRNLDKNRAMYLTEDGFAQTQLDIWKKWQDRDVNASELKDMTADERLILDDLYTGGESAERIVIRLENKQLLFFMPRCVVYVTHSKTSIWQNPEIYKASIMPGSDFAVEVECKTSTHILQFKTFPDCTLAQILLHQRVVKNRLTEDLNRM